MKTGSLLFVFLVFLLSCKKETAHINTFKPDPDFRITGLHSYLFERNPLGQYGTVSYRLQFVYGSGVPRQLELAIENPTNFLTTRLTVAAGYPDFETELFVTDSVGPKGTYTLNLVVRSEDSIVQRFPFEVVIAGNEDWLLYFNGQHFTGVSFCPTEALHDAINVRQIAPDSDTLLFENMIGQMGNLKLVPDRIAKTLLVPAQVIKGDTFAGVGKIVIDPYSLDFGLKIDLTRTPNGGTPQQCLYELKKP